MQELREDDTWCKINSVNPIWRTYYIEELFSAEKMEEPDWYTFRQHSDLIQADVTPGKIITTKSNTLLFDSLFFSGVNDWNIAVRFSEPKSFPGSLGIRINEYAIQFTSFSTFTDTSKSTFIKAMTLDQFKIRTDQNILFWDTLSSADEKFDLSIKKIKKTVYVFFENDLRACIPFDNSLTLSGYSAFKRKGPYMIRVYASESPKR
ncbi:MAG: hypothetical protein C0490_16870 [Marivirga sp.]|nr:hypothetical protein [Marivirga sp.]